MSRNYQLLIPPVFSWLCSSRSFTKSGVLPNRIDVTVEMETCLPASEWTIEHAEQFEKQFIDRTHTITVHVDATDVVVHVNFQKVDVLQEGVSALLR